jgi:two-component system, sensor histidine kinase ChiS
MRILLTIQLAFFLSHTYGQAVLDFSKHDFAKGKGRLNGQWEFYWEQLLSPDDLKSAVPAGDQLYVPGSWSYGGKYSNLGRCTYRIKVILPENVKTDLSFYFPPVRCAAKVWVNGVLKDSLGSVGNRENYHSQLSGLLLSVPSEKEVELVVQVANYDYLSGGLVSGVWLGRTSEIQHDINIKSGLDTIFAGSLLAMFVYLLMMFLLYRRGSSFLFLAMICLCVALRTVVIESGSVLLPQLFPSTGWAIWKKIEFFSVYGIVALFPLYVSSVFPTVSIKKIDWIFITLALILCIVVLLTPHYIYGRLLDIAHVGLLAGFAYAVWVISKGLKQKIQDARILLTGVLAAFPFILLEIIKNTSFLNVRLPFMYLVEFGVLTFLLFQVYVLGNHHAKAYDSLEKLVDERTLELLQANKIKDKLLSIISHDIKVPFNSLRGIVSLFNQGFINGEELGSVMKKIESQMGITNLLIENVLLWVRSQMAGVIISVEPVSLGNLVNEHLSIYETTAAEKKIQLVNEIHNELCVNADKHVLSLVLRNLISNAIKYSFENGKVRISAHKADGHVSLSISDNGTGMSESTLTRLLQHEDLTSELGTQNEMGTGLGLMVSREYLLKMGSELTVESILGKGSTFRISLVSGLAEHKN